MQPPMPKDKSVPLATFNYPWYPLVDLADPGTDSDTILATAATANVDYWQRISSPEYVYNNRGDGLADMRAEPFAPSANGVLIAFYGTNAANEDFGFDLYACRSGGPLVPVYISSAACILGTLPCEKYPIGHSDGSTYAAGDALTTGFWCDTIAGTDCWPSGVTVTDSGNNRIATMKFDLLGFRYLYMHTFDAGDAGVVATVGAIITAY